MEACHQTIFDFAKRTADMLVKMFGNRCEVAVHDFSNLENSLIHSAGNVTNQDIGSPITNLVLEELRKTPSEIKDIPNYKTHTKTGNIMKSSTVFLRDEKGNVIGALCMNYDISLLMNMDEMLQDFISFDEHQPKSESFFTSIHNVIQGMVDQVLHAFKKLLSLEEKIEFVRQLEDRGTFLIKGSTDYVATVLGVSKFTIYNYLQKIRTQNEYFIPH
ncbi:PAS domain-containing protein [Bacillus sp. FJAT-49705]|uniref:PAS domain-containing protein n=1 Tax=Cytobacillus citreus TaxID=2833586 RepID=A0ABS5NRH5_9BACI|nr:PAS domain-containing protein [Cytobacillus citreus]MBS4190176.1 PAS domain-containing protein [Cytobacillus citreus]